MRKQRPPQKSKEKDGVHGVALEARHSTEGMRYLGEDEGKKRRQKGRVKKGPSRFTVYVRRGPNDREEERGSEGNGEKSHH